MRLLIISGLILFSYLISAQNEFVHPRGIITQEEVKIIHEKIKWEPFKTWFEKIMTTTVQAVKILDKSDPYQTTFLAQKQAQLYH